MLLNIDNLSLDFFKMKGHIIMKKGDLWQIYNAIYFYLILHQNTKLKISIEFFIFFLGDIKY